jgi:hypothetical protein
VKGGWPDDLKTASTYELRKRSVKTVMPHQSWLWTGTSAQETSGRRMREILRIMKEIPLPGRRCKLLKAFFKC